MQEVFNMAGITADDYFKALSISKDRDYEIHLKRSTNSCFVNNYFQNGLQAWQANIDIQSVFNHYKAVTYMCTYFSKSEDECSEAMKQAAKEAFENHEDHYRQMRKIANAYSTKRECNIQEAVYHCLPELHLRRVFPKVVFANSNLPDQRFKILKTKKELEDLPDDSEDIFKRNNIDRYVERPKENQGKYAALKDLCFAEFLANYEVSKREDDGNEYQPGFLPDELIEDNHEQTDLPKVVPINKKEKMILRKVPKVVRYHVPKSREIYPERCAYHLLFLFYPFYNESELLLGNPPSYVNKLDEEGVIDIINNKRKVFEPFSDLVDTAFNQYRSDLQPSFDAEGQIQNDETSETSCENDDELNLSNTNVDTPQSFSITNTPLVMPDDQILSMINYIKSKTKASI